MKKTVLIVEDNELNMKLFNDLLEAHGYDTVQTKSGVEAVSLARQHMPQLILMDIQLPEVSGLQVTQWLKDDPTLAHIPVVAITAFAMKGDEARQPLGFGDEEAESCDGRGLRAFAAVTSGGFHGQKRFP